MNNILSIIAGVFFKKVFSNSVGSLKPKLPASRERFMLTGIYVGNRMLPVLTFNIGHWTSVNRNGGKIRPKFLHVLSLQPCVLVLLVHSILTLILNSIQWTEQSEQNVAE